MTTAVLDTVDISSLPPDEILFDWGGESSGLILVGLGVSSKLTHNPHSSLLTFLVSDTYVRSNTGVSRVWNPHFIEAAFHTPTAFDASMSIDTTYRPFVFPALPDPDLPRSQPVQLASVTMKFGTYKRTYLDAVAGEKENMPRRLPFTSRNMDTFPYLEMRLKKSDVLQNPRDFLVSVLDPLAPKLVLAGTLPVRHQIDLPIPDDHRGHDLTLYRSYRFRPFQQTD